MNEREKFSQKILRMMMMISNIIYYNFIINLTFCWLLLWIITYFKLFLYVETKEEEKKKLKINKQKRKTCRAHTFLCSRSLTIISGHVNYKKTSEQCVQIM